jgi:hypothetical protein
MTFFDVLVLFGLLLGSAHADCSFILIGCFSFSFRFDLWRVGLWNGFGFGDGEYFRRGLSGWLGHSFHIGLKLSNDL